MVEGEEGSIGTASGRVVNSLFGTGEGGVSLSFRKNWNNTEDSGEVLASWLFAQFLLTNEVQIAYSQTEGYVPVTKKAQSSNEYQNYLNRAGENNDLYYDVKIEASKLLINNTENSFTTPVFNGSTSLRSAAGELIEETVKLDFDGYSIGGVANDDESKEDMYKAIEYSTPYLPKDKVRYLMGVGEPVDILEGIERGVDIFDCVLPTRIARHGQAFTRDGKINLNNAKFIKDFLFFSIRNNSFQNWNL